ncbi:MAG TPA: DnaD domain protein [Anaerolineales bacterium]|nr:DnaD domain protein [Anaerolineales bacterium]
MSKFKGFSESETFTELPDSFFHQLLKQIDDPAELKVTLYFLWRASHMEGPFRALSKMDFNVKELGLPGEEIASGLEKAVQRGALLKVQRETVVYFLLNSPRGRAGVQAIENGQWNPQTRISAPPIERPNVFKLYEENIGPLTPLIADALKDAEETYSAEWIGEAIELAVKNNKRNWKYCEAILKRWKEEGRAEKQDRRDAEKDRRKFFEGEYADYIEH